MPGRIYSLINLLLATLVISCSSADDPLPARTLPELVQGIHIFQAEEFPEHEELFEDLSKGQSPRVLFITCADSRISPHLITQARPGDLFIHRNVGNIVPSHGQGPAEAATVQYAVEALGVTDIVICGHSQCGAMKALLEGHGDLSDVGSWLQNAAKTKGIIDQYYTNLEEEDKLDTTIEENVLVQLEQLRTYPSISKALASREIRLHGWVYEIRSGRVFRYSVKDARFMPITQG